MKTLSVINTSSETRKASKSSHWRSFEQLDNTTSFQHEVSAEFAHGQDLGDSAGGVSRRDTLKLMGASFALAGVSSACVRRPEENILPYAKQPEMLVPGSATYFASSYPEPHGAVGILVESHEGRPTKIEGNPDHPGSLGRSDVHMQAHVLQMYDPDRSRDPVKDGSYASWAEWDTNAVPAMQKGKLAVLHDGSNGPTFERIRGELEQKGASFYEYEPLRWDAAYTGAEMVFGNSARVHYDLEKADRIVSLDADFLYEGPDHLKNAAGFGKGRGFDRVPSAKDAKKMNRLYVVESVYSVTGSSADHRLRVASSQVGAFAKLLAKELVQKGASVPADLGGNGALGSLSSSFKPGNAKMIPAMAKDLLAHKGKSVIIAGPRQPAAVHALAALLNAALGAFNSGAAKATRGFPSVAGMAMPIPTDHGAAKPPEDEAPTETKPAAEMMAEGEADEGTPAEAAPAKPAADLPAHKGAFAQLAALKKALEGGQVDTLLILGTNPVATAPNAMELGDAMKKAKQVVHAGLYWDESARDAALHVPLAHGLEAWGDAVAYDGTLTVNQPLIQPLFGARSAIELLAQVAGKSNWKGKALVEDTWKKSHGLSAKDWRRLLHDGATKRAHREPLTVAQGKSSASADVAAALGKLDDKGPGDGNLELVFVPGSMTLDGRHANLGWLQEMPDPMTKLCWDNALVVGPALAKKLGIKSKMSKNVFMADIATVKTAAGSVDAPVFVLPGLAPHTAMMSLGYGRDQSGDVAKGVGIDATPLLPEDGSLVALGASITPTGRKVDLCSTQDHFAVENDPIQDLTEMSLGGRPLAVATSVDAYEKNPAAAAATANMPENLLEKTLKQDSAKPLRGIQLAKLDPLAEEWTYEGQAWGMTIDLTACIGCHACAVACQAENNVPVVGRKWVEFGRELHWLRVDRYYRGAVDEPESVSQPVPCMHCENAPCEPVCPFAATVHDSEGINAMVYNRCAGTRYCANNCAYKVRRFNYFDFSDSGNLYVEEYKKKRMETLKMQRNPDVSVRYRGVMEKCTYCTQRVQEAKYKAKRKGEDHNNLPDGAVTPACAQSCPTGAISFGNINGKTKDGKPHEVAKRKLSDRNYEMLSELNDRPRTTYLAKLRNLNPELG